MARAKTLLPGKAWRYHVVGAGEDLNILRNQAAALYLDEHVEFCGWLETERVQQLMQSSDVLLHPARYDPLPVVVLEAMAAGMVVLGSDAAGSVRDRIRNGVNGMLHPAGDVETFSEQIASILTNPQSFTSLSTNAQQTAEQWPVTRGIEILKGIVQA